MPLYEYECDACSHRFEVIQKFSDAPIEKCRACGGTVHKLQSAPAFHLKGTGWYATDYAKSGSTAEKTGKDGGKDGDKDSKKAEGGSDTSASVEKSKSTEGGSTSSTSSTGSGTSSSTSSTSSTSSPGAAKSETPKA